jgi:aryl-alcohol dehydrogenase-like predicted oxidoreductase
MAGPRWGGSGTKEAGLQRILLGETGLEVSRICFGTWAFGGAWGAFDEAEAIAAVRAARELGIDFFDTAHAYGSGRAERVLGRGLREEIAARRGDVVLATKGGLRMEGSRILRDASPAWLRQGLRESLDNLGTDYIDIYQVHWPDPNTPIERTAETLDEFVRAGRVRWAGVSNFDVAQMGAFGRVRRVDTLQPPYHLLRRDIEADVLPYCSAHGIGVFVYGALAHGLLTGKYGAGVRFPADDWRADSGLFEGAEYRRNVRVVERLAGLAASSGRTVAQLAVGWVLAHPAVHCAILGARSPAQLRETAAAADLPLDDALKAEVELVAAEAAASGGPSPEGARR